MSDKPIESEFKDEELEDILYSKKHTSLKTITSLIRGVVNDFPLQCLALSFTLGLLFGLALTEKE